MRSGGSGPGQREMTTPVEALSEDGYQSDSPTDFNAPMTSQADSTESDEDEYEDETIQPDAKRSRSEVSVTPEPDDPEKRRKLIKYQRLWDESLEYRNTSTMMGRLRNSPKQGKRYPYKGFNNDSEYNKYHDHNNQDTETSN